MQNKFYNSKLNTVLLLVLIILMMIALCWMYQNKQTYMPTPAVKQESQIEGNKEDLVSFSIKPGQEVSGKMTVDGILKGAYFFEANLLVNILDANKNPTSYGPGHANATTDWMTAGPVSFAFDIDFSLMPKGNYYIKLTQDDPSGGESGKPIKYVIIPIVVK